MGTGDAAPAVAWTQTAWPPGCLCRVLAGLLRATPGYSGLLRVKASASPRPTVLFGTVLLEGVQGRMNAGRHWRQQQVRESRLPWPLQERKADYQEPETSVRREPLSPSVLEGERMKGLHAGIRALAIPVPAPHSHPARDPRALCPCSAIPRQSNLSPLFPPRINLTHCFECPSEHCESYTIN